MLPSQLGRLEVSHALALHRGIMATPRGPTKLDTRENPFTQVWRVYGACCFFIVFHACVVKACFDILCQHLFDRTRNPLVGNLESETICSVRTLNSSFSLAR